VVPVLLLIAAFQGWDAVEARRLARAEAAMPWGDPARAPRPGESGGAEDAMLFYNAAATLQSGPATPRGAPGNDPVWNRRESFAATGVLPPGAGPAARAAIDAASLRLIDDAAARPIGRVVPARASAYRPLALPRLFEAAATRTLDNIAAMDADAAVDSIGAQLRLLRIYRDGWLYEATMKEVDVAGIAVDAAILLSHAVPDDGRLTVLVETLAQADDDDEVVRAISAEARFVSGAVSPSTALALARTWPASFLVQPLLRHYAATLLMMTEDALAVAARPWPARVRDLQALTAPASSLPIVHEFFEPTRVLSGYQQRAVAAAVNASRLRAARLAALVERYRRRTGALPDLLADATGQDRSDRQSQDPFTGDSMRWSIDAAGYTIYSVGPDGRDDGGALEPRDVPAGRMPRTVRPPDIGIRVNLAR
jgi:hypothetical protein